ncbi:hypothetical protein E2C01_030063 [Portunus trituberculatus]|uniref:Uncharacterized protein n=1 Tax=Portunus trituberculatus TaxID=210409 RepID=A0A5B7ETN6_PORTR|nr:hypothetical protein [Portunus trituberculatus]
MVTVQIEQTLINTVKDNTLWYYVSSRKVVTKLCTDITPATSLESPRYYRPLESSQPNVRLCLVVGCDVQQREEQQREA